MKGLILFGFLSLPVAAMACGGYYAQGCCDVCWQFNMNGKMERLQRYHIAEEQHKAIRNGGGIGTVAGATANAQGSALANATTIGNQSFIIVDGDGNVITLNTDQSNFDSSFGSSNTLSGNEINNDFINVEGDMTETTTNTTTNTTNKEIIVEDQK